MVERMKIHVYTVCWNEEDLLPFYFKHYERFVDKVIVYDNMSSDKTPELLESHPLCERRTYDSGGEVRDDFLLKLKNNAWKESRGKADWVIVCDVDEFIFHPDLVAYLSSCKERGVTIPQPTGFNMVSDQWPEPDKQIWEQIRDGRPDLFFSKKAVFDPNEIKEINYRPGAHTCFPAGRVKEERDPNFKLLHYKYIGGVEWFRKRRTRFAKRLSQLNKRFGWGTQARAADAAQEYEYEKSLARPINLDYQAAANEAQRKKVLFVAGIGGLPDVTRLAGLAHALDPAKYEAHLACDLNGSALPENLPFNVVPITSIPARKAQEATSQGKPIFDAGALDKLIWEDIRIIRELSPEIVVGDMRQSLAISTLLANITYVNIINAQWSPYACLPFELPHNPLASLIGQPLADLAFSFAAPLAFASHIAPLNAARAKYRMPPVHWNVKGVYSYGDYALYPDIPQLVPTSGLPSNHHYIGPVLWSPHTSAPTWWDQLPSDRPLIYVNLGSSGQHTLLPVVLRALGRLPVTVMAATASTAKVFEVPANVYLAQYLPGSEAAQRSQLVICNGGNMSTQQALAGGAPVLAIISNLDQLLFARAVERAGAGEVLREGEVEEGLVKRVVWRMLRWRGYREAARGIAEVYKQMDAALLFPKFIDSISEAS
jgi:UDP:flavonoid glycosyltransferase YjiC (YdhE family)/glycosyltransferase involved in cell wall biosynthesis